MPAVPAPLPPNEGARLAALHQLQLLDTLPERTYDDIVRLASQICGTPIGVVSLVASDRQWFKAVVGHDASGTDRDSAFCAHAIVGSAPCMVVEDATRDARFLDNPLVTGDPHIRFYAGAPIVLPGGHALGTVCAIDTVPRQLDAAQLGALEALARQVGALFELRQRTLESERLAREFEALSREAAAERQRSAELLDLVLRGGNLGLWDLHVPTGAFIANEREHAMLGFAVGTPLDWRELMHPDDWPVLATTMAAHLRGATSHFACEHRMRHRDGHWVWVLDHAVVVERDASGAAQRVVGTHMDISSRISNRHALQHARDLLQRMGKLAQVGGWEMDLESGRITWTEEVYRIHELDPSVTPDVATGIDFYAPEARPVIAAAFERAVAHATPYDLELPFVSARGRARIVRCQGEAVVEGGKVRRLFGTFQDVTARQAAERAALDSERRLRLIADHMPALIAYIDKDERYRFMSAHIQRVFGTDIRTRLGDTVREVRGEAAYAQLAPHVATALSGAKTSFSYSDRVDAADRHYQAHYVPDVGLDGEVQGFYAMTFDITELHRTQRQLEQLARVDTLTGLPNRRQFEERIADALPRARRLQTTCALMFLDIDHFKHINDSLGHAAGDAVLCEFAQRLKRCVRTTDTVARLGGDEFVVLLENLGPASEIEAVAAKVVAAIRPAFALQGAPLAVSTSVGVATCTGAPGTTPEDLLARADAALYRAKSAGRNRFVVA